MLETVVLWVNDNLPYKRKSFRRSKKKISIPKSALLHLAYRVLHHVATCYKREGQNTLPSLVVASSGFSENKGLAGVLSLSRSENLVSVVLFEGFSQKKQKNALGV